MEVHHHSHKPKNWKEYITEFIMLFAAVTLGFLAENLREHQVINHRIEQNKIAIYKDLQADSSEIARVLNVEDNCINTFNRFNNLLYLAKNNKITQNQLIDSIKITSDLIAYSTTLYVNNSSFKNLQSSGLLSNLEEGTLKNTLATYYEVDFKAVEAANDFFDQEGIIFNNYFPIGLGKGIRESLNLSKEYVLNDKNGFENFMLSLDKTKKILQSDDFIYEVQKYYNFIYYYRVNIYRAKKSNDALLKLLRSELK
ncbi:MAG: hypothetical protein WCH36_03060 [Chitinophagaceae bacterium]|jgi:hypothetical protein